MGAGLGSGASWAILGAIRGTMTDPPFYGASYAYRGHPYPPGKVLGNEWPKTAPYADVSGIQTLYAAAPGAACKVSFPFSKVRPQNGPGGGWKRLPPGQRIGPGLTGWAFL